MSFQVSNEDRHFTTQILAAGYSVLHCPSAVVRTDTPNTIPKWFRQQVRWMRGTMVETAAYPNMRHRLFPWTIYTIIKTRLVPLAAFAVIVQTAAMGRLPSWVNGVQVVRDFWLAAALQVGYLLAAQLNGVRPRGEDVLWALSAMAWFAVWMPAIVVWSLLTVFDGSWGTPMRAALKVKENRGVMGSRVARLAQVQVPWDLVFMSGWAVMVTVAFARIWWQ